MLLIERLLPLGLRFRVPFAPPDPMVAALDQVQVD
jgi:hypothetical protein